MDLATSKEYFFKVSAKLAEKSGRDCSQDKLYSKLKDTTLTGRPGETKIVKKMLVNGE
jgi:hypothetical protein